MAKKKKHNKLKKILNNFKNTSLKNKRIIILTIISILVLITLVSTTFAMFIVKEDSKKKTTYTGGNLSVSFDDANGNAISINPARPMTDSYAMTIEPYKFTITNNGTLNATYRIVLTDEVISNPNGLTNEQVKENIKIQVNGNEPVLLSELVNNTITTGIIDAQKTKEFSIRLWIKLEASNDIEKTSYSAKIAVTGKSTVKKENPCGNGKENTLACKILGNDYANVTSIEPTFSSTSTDRGLFVQKGDSAKSINGNPTYYFRGSATNNTINPDYKMNNYVKFGKYQTVYGYENTVGDDIIWRIVRINEDGTIRLITEKNIAGYYNNYDSVEDWYSSNLGNTTLDSKVKKSDFCSDTTGFSGEGSYGNAYRRLYTNTPQPIFTCASGATVTSSKVGQITADEVVYSGGFYMSLNASNPTYLYTNTLLWTNTPEIHYYGTLEAMSLNYGGFADGNFGTGPKEYRAVINLTSDITVSGGDGLSAATAYVIE